MLAVFAADVGLFIAFPAFVLWKLLVWLLPFVGTWAWCGPIEHRLTPGGVFVGGLQGEAHSWSEFDGFAVGPRSVRLLFRDKPGTGVVLHAHENLEEVVAYIGEQLRGR